MTAEKEKLGDASLTLAYLTSNLTPSSARIEEANQGGDREIEIVPTRYTRPILSDEMVSAENSAPASASRVSADRGKLRRHFGAVSKISCRPRRDR